MKLHFHGGAKEVGRSCIELQSKEKILLDVGVKFVSEGLAFPKNVFNHQAVDATLLSHAHLDHSGGLPLFEHKHLEGPIYTTKQTLEIAKILLNDSYKIARIKHLHPEYDRSDLRQVQKDATITPYKKWHSVGNSRFKFYNAGHVPGSTMILVESDGNTILYTGDFNTRATSLLYPAKAQDIQEDIDILITESTYGNKELPNRDEEKRRFFEAIKKTLRRNGNVIIPVFALQRAQEILMMLGKKDFNVPIFLDGMAKDITKTIVENQTETVKDEQTLANMYHNKVELISSQKRRQDSLNRQGIFVTTSGMLQGGPVMSYLEEVWHQKKHSILLTGFQPEGTNGRRLLEEGYIFLDRGKTHVKCQTEQFEFSAHSSAENIKSFAQNIDAQHTIFQHGDKKAVQTLKKWGDHQLDGEAYAPDINQKYTF